MLSHRGNIVVIIAVDVVNVMIRLILHLGIILDL
jgi:hypothetical protein